MDARLWVADVSLGGESMALLVDVEERDLGIEKLGNTSSCRC